MVAAVTLTDDGERRRRSLLAASDSLLDRVEELRLLDRVDTPPPLQDAIQQLRTRLDTSARDGHASTLEAAHDLIFAVQERLMALNEARPTPRAHPGRAEGTAITKSLEGGQRWKVLALPPRPESAGAEPAWHDLVAATLDRALDRWAWAHHHAVQAIRRGRDPGPGLRLVEEAWHNYWSLTREAQLLGALSS
jgi:hypothetical protein